MRRSAAPLALVASLVACDGGPGERSDPPLVVLVSLDTLRADHVSAYGYGRNTTPHLDALAAEGVVFERAFAQASNTLVSHKSMLTGKQPLRLVHEGTNATEDLLREHAEPTKFLVSALTKAPATLAESLRSDGYRTAAFTDGVWMDEQFGFAAGFDTFVAEDHAGLAATVPQALDWARGLGDARGFLFLHTYDVHCPYEPPEPFRSLFCKDHAAHVSLQGECPKRNLEKLRLQEVDRRAIVDHYDGGIVYADDLVGDLFDGLRDAGRWDEALVIVTSDHGEALGDHGQIGHGGLWPEQVFVPLIVKFPASWKLAPRRVADAVELTDLVPTLLEASGQRVPDGLDGRSLLAAAAGGRVHRRAVAQVAFNEFVGEGRWVSNPVKRAVYDPDGWFLLVDAKADSRELWRVEDTRAVERVEDPRLAADLESTLAALELAGSDGQFREPAEQVLGSETLESLKGLGYLGEDQTELGDD